MTETVPKDASHSLVGLLLVLLARTDRPFATVQHLRTTYAELMDVTAYLSDKYALFSLECLGFDVRVNVVAVEEPVEILVELMFTRAFAGPSSEDLTNCLGVV